MENNKTKIKSYFESWKKVFRDKNITAIQKVVLKDLEIYRNTRSGYSWPSLITLADDVGVNERTIRRAMDILEEMKLVEVVREKGRVNKYRLARKLTYPLHEIEANHGHESPYFEAIDIDDSDTMDKNEPNHGHGSPGSTDISVQRTISKELNLRRDRGMGEEKPSHPADDSGDNLFNFKTGDPTVEGGKKVYPVIRTNFLNFPIVDEVLDEIIADEKKESEVTDEDIPF